MGCGMPDYLVYCVLVAALFVSGCGPTIKSFLQPGAVLPTSIAVLPADYSADIPRQRIDYIRSALISELRNNNFIVVDDKVLNSACSSPACPEMKALADKYLIDGFVNLKLESLSRNNFIAGYYNALSGELDFTDRAGQQLATVKHTESERGGLLFESGQVIQGIISQVKNSGDSAFDKLGNKFARTLVASLPPAQPSEATPSAPEGAELVILSSTVDWQSPSALKLCIAGTPYSFAYALAGEDRSALREVTPGQYCGAFGGLSMVTSAPSVTVELRTVFGNAVRKDVSLPIEPVCSPENRVEISEAAGKTFLGVKCATVGKDSSSSTAGCSDIVKSCSTQKLVVFQASSPAGPFKRIRDVTMSRSSIPNVEGSVQVVFVGAAGLPSLPVDISEEKK
jgi:hypothetical protein